MLLSDKRKISTKNHSTYIIPMIVTILNENNLSINNINEIVVINGPGSFTGIRLGVTVAKTLAYTLNIPIKTVTSIEAIAVSSQCEGYIIVTVPDSKGRYVGEFLNKKLIKPLTYMTNEKYAEYIKSNNNDIINNQLINALDVINYCKDLNNTNPHEVKAQYIKNIEALNDK